MVVVVEAKHGHESSVGRSKSPWKSTLALGVCPRQGAALHGSGRGGQGFAIRLILSAASGKQFPESYPEGQEELKSP